MDGQGITRRDALKWGIAAAMAGGPLVSLLAGESGGRSAASVYADAVVDRVRRLPQQIKMTAKIADTVADRVVKGGALRLIEKGGGLGEESARRAGGMILVDWPIKGPANLETVILGSEDGFGTYDADQIRPLRAKGCCVIALCSRDQKAAWSGAHGAIENYAPIPDGVILLPRTRKRICPLGITMNTATLWMLESELFFALVRRGRMPVVLKSMALPDANPRNEQVDKKPFHDRCTAKPRASGEAAAEFVDHLTTLVTAIRDTQLEPVRSAAQLAMKAIRAGGRLFIAPTSHVAYHFCELAGDPKVFTMRMPWDKNFGAGLTKKDLVFFLSYYGLPGDAFGMAARSGCKIVWSGIPKEGESLEHPALSGVIDQKWVLGDACVSIEGYDCKIAPLSGVAHAMIYYMLCGEIASLSEGN